LTSLEGNADWKFGTIVADPPWAYTNASSHEKLTGYVSKDGETIYQTLTTSDICDLPVSDYAADDSVLMMWSTWPFVPDALKIIECWGFDYVTALPMIKVDSKEAPKYGVGYWFRGCSEVVLVAKRKKGKSYRSNFLGILTPSMSHSRKPEHLYEVAETYPGPRLELFARGDTAYNHGWYALGNEAHLDGKDIRDTASWVETWESQRDAMSVRVA
jgi:N6-adenosine-specific RNA methylase IME4